MVENGADFTLGLTAEMAYQIERGVKPIGFLLVHKNHLKAVYRYLKNEHPDLKIISAKHAEKHHQVYLYRFAHQKHVICFTLSRSFNAEIFTHWLQGKMFGYSDEAIENYVRKNSGRNTKKRGAA